MTELDYKKVYNVVLKLGAKLGEINSCFKIRPPKKYARELLRNVNSKKNLAGIFLLYRMELKPNALYTAQELNKLISDNLMDSAPYHKGDIVTDSKEFKGSGTISTNRMSEVLKTLKDFGWFSKIEGKKEIRKVAGPQTKAPGRPSGFRISSDRDQLAKLISKPAALEIIMSCLKETNLLYDFFKYSITSFLYLVKFANKKQLYEGFRTVTDENSKQLSSLASEYINIKPKLNMLNDTQIEQVAELAIRHDYETILKDKRDLLIRLILLLNTFKL